MKTICATTSFALDASDFVLYLPSQIDEMFGNMNRDILQEEARLIIISDMVKRCVVLLAFIWLSFGALRWIRSAFEEGL